MPMTVAERVRLLLTLKNVGFADIAKAAGLDRQAVWKIVRGDTPNPGILTIEKIVTAAGSTVIEYYSLKELSMADQLVQEVRRVLLNATDGKGTAPGFLTAFQILDRLPQELRDGLIRQRGGVGAGSGASYSPTKDIANAIKALGNEVEPLYMDARGITFKVGDETVSPGYGMISIYRIKVEG